MGNKLFGVNISGLVAKHVGPGLLDVVIVKQASGDRDPDNLTGGQPKTPTTFRGIKGIWQDLPKMPPPGVTFELNDRIALLIGDTVPAGGLPKRNDTITIEKLTLYAVQQIGRDPAAAGYLFLCRERKTNPEH